MANALDGFVKDLSAIIDAVESGTMIILKEPATGLLQKAETFLKSEQEEKFNGTNRFLWT